MAYKHEDLNLNPQPPHKKPSLTTCVTNLALGRQRQEEPQKLAGQLFLLDQQGSTSVRDPDSREKTLDMDSS